MGSLSSPLSPTSSVVEHRLSGSKWWRIPQGSSSNLGTEEQSKPVSGQEGVSSSWFRQQQPQKKQAKYLIRLCSTCGSSTAGVFCLEGQHLGKAVERSSKQEVQ